MKKTALVKHCFKYEHRIDLVNLEILNFSIDFDKIKFLEPLYINKTKNSINDKNWNVFPKIFFFFWLLPTRSRYSATVFSILFDLLHLLP